MTEVVWPDEIVKALVVRQRLDELDSVPVWSYPLPHVAVDEEGLQVTERSLGMPLDPQYRGFLRHADGWPKFYQDVDLFGTRELLSGPEHDSAKETLDVLDGAGSLARVGLTKDSLLPIAASALQTDLFVMADRGGEHAHVLWLAGDLVEEFPSFSEYFLAMLDYERRQIVYFETGQWPATE
mgnify:CR=1 FL=1